LPTTATGLEKYESTTLSVDWPKIVAGESRIRLSNQVLRVRTFLSEATGDPLRVPSVMSSVPCGSTGAVSPLHMLYEDRLAQFRWQVPDEFNFAWDVIDAYAQDRSRLALVWENEAGEEARYSFWDVAERSRRFANVLRALGIGRGDPVMIMLPRIPEWQIAFLGALRLGALVIPCTGQLRARDIAYRANHSEAKAIVT